MYYKLKYLAFTLLALIIFAVSPPLLQAQMFSIDDPEGRTERTLGVFTMVGASWDFADFSYTGDAATEDQRVDFNDSIFRLRLESPGINVSAGFGGSFTGMNDNSYINVDGRIFNKIALTRSDSFLLTVPIQLTTDLTQVRLNRTDAEFSQSSLVFGTGLAGDLNLGERISLNLQATPNYGFSFSQGSLFGGSLFRFDAKSLLFIHDVIGSRSLTLGYHFDFRRYDIDGDLNDYDFTSHSVTLGITF